MFLRLLSLVISMVVDYQILKRWPESIESLAVRFSPTTFTTWDARKRLVMPNDFNLTDLMVRVLNEVSDIRTTGARTVAYVRAGINLRDHSFEEINVADQRALSIELGRRLRDAPTEHDSRCA